MNGLLIDVRGAWIGVLEGCVRAAETHAVIAARRAGSGRIGAEARWAAELRRGFERVLMLHPEWADDAPEWPGS